MWEYKTVEGSVSVQGYRFQGNGLKVVQMLVLTFFLPFRIAHQNIRFIIISLQTVFIFCHRELLGRCSTGPGLTTCESLVSILPDTKKVCGSAQPSKQECVVSPRFPAHPPPFLLSTEMDPLVKRHLCFLLSLQDWMSWFRTHKCDFKFDCLLVYFMHLLLEEGETRF